jgi:hypothetical protein
MGASSAADSAIGAAGAGAAGRGLAGIEGFNAGLAAGLDGGGVHSGSSRDSSTVSFAGAISLSAKAEVFRCGLESAAGPEQAPRKNKDKNREPRTGT